MTKSSRRKSGPTRAKKIPVAHNLQSQETGVLPQQVPIPPEHLVNNPEEVGLFTYIALQPGSSALVVVNIALVVLIMYFPHHSTHLATLMSWWWFRLAALLALGTLSVYTFSTRVLDILPSGALRLCILLFAAVFIAACNTAVTRRAVPYE